MLEDFCGRMAVAGVSLILTHTYLPGYFLRRGFKEDKKWGALVRSLWIGGHNTRFRAI